MYTDEILTKLGKMNVKNPCVLFVGRNGTRNYFSSPLDDKKEMHHRGFRVINVNEDESVLPDIHCDFNSPDERKLLVDRIENDFGGTIVMVIFDASVLKFMKDLPRMFLDIREMLAPGGYFITEYNLCGDMFFTPDNISKATITDLNFIQIPLRLCRYKTYRDELKRLSQAMVQCELENLFHEATIHHNEPYPFLLNYTQTFYLCKKQ